MPSPHWHRPIHRRCRRDARPTLKTPVCEFAMVGACAQSMFLMLLPVRVERVAVALVQVQREAHKLAALGSSWLLVA